jgi:gamma-glutamyltranspeptidase
VLLEMLAALGTLEPEPADALTAALLGIEDRDAWLGDPRCTEIPLDRLLDPEQARARLAETRRAPAAASAAKGDTVAVVAVDDEGRGVSLIQSVFNTFGAAILEPATGIISQNRGRGFSLRPGAPNELAPGARPMHTLTPLMVLEGGKVRAAVGTMGGRAQPQILLQALGGTVGGASLEETLARPRWAVGARDLGFDRQTVVLEEHASAGLEASLAEVGLPVVRIPRHDERVGHTQLVRAGGPGLEAASDPRSDGEAAVTLR